MLSVLESLLAWNISLSWAILELKNGNFEAMDCGRDDLTRHFIADVWDWLHIPLLLQHGLRKELSWFNPLVYQTETDFLWCCFYISTAFYQSSTVPTKKWHPFWHSLWTWTYMKLSIKKNKGDGIYIWFTIIMNKFGCLKWSCLENDCYDDKRFSLNFLSLSFKFNQWYSSSFITKIDDF